MTDRNPRSNAFLKLVPFVVEAAFEHRVLVVANRPSDALRLLVDRTLDRRSAIGHGVGVIAADDSLLVDGQLHHAVGLLLAVTLWHSANTPSGSH